MSRIFEDRLARTALPQKLGTCWSLKLVDAYAQGCSSRWWAINQLFKCLFGSMPRTAVLHQDRETGQREWGYHREVSAAS
jgi:hypothetical protein